MRTSLNSMLGRLKRGSTQDLSADALADEAKCEGAQHRSGSASSRRGRSGKFSYTVPDGARPGQVVQIPGPSGTLVEIRLPARCRPGQVLTVNVEDSGHSDGHARSSSFNSRPRAAMDELRDQVSSFADATKASCDSLRQRLQDELELQKALWHSAKVASAADGSGSFQQRQQERTLVLSSADEEFSQTQALVFAAAEVGDCSQLLAALEEARRFSNIAVSLEEAVRELAQAEEAMVTWRCLLDALDSQDRHGIEVWLEQARGLGLKVPGGLQQALFKLQKQEEDSLRHFAKFGETEQRLRFALEAGDRELIEESLAHAQAIGFEGDTVKEAIRFLYGSATPPHSPVGSSSRARPSENKSSTASTAAGSGASANGFADRNTTSEEQPAGTSFDVPPWRESAGDFSTSSHATAANERADRGDRQSAPRATSTTAAEDFACKGVRELIEECRRRGYETSACTDREDLLRLLVEGPAASSRRPSSKGFSVKVPATEAKSCGDSVWNRRTAPPHIVSRRGQALWLLGFGGSIARRLPAAELRSAYRRAAMESHPDKHQNHARQDEAKELFQKVKEAYDYLSSPAAGVVA